MQGPALCVHNNSVFSENDIESIQKLGVGSKSMDPDKTGQFGELQGGIKGRPLARLGVRCQGCVWEDGDLSIRGWGFVCWRMGISLLKDGDLSIEGWGFVYCAVVL